MDMRCFFYVIFFIPSFVAGGTWNNLNCPAPRAPDNGLSFIFRNGELVHFRCHPGYVMRGKPVAYCVNNVWTEVAPECLPIQKWPLETKSENDILYYNNRNYGKNSDSPSSEYQRQLFSWGDDDNKQTPRQGVYGDGPRRLPLINGIWPSQDQKEQVLALGPQSTPGPKTMIKEEIDIAELRQKQLEELREQRNTNPKGDKKRQRNRNKNKKNHVIPDDTVPRETVISLGTTEDGDALSISLAKSENQTARPHPHHRKRHRNHRRKNHQNRKYKVVHPTMSANVIRRPSRVDTSGIAPFHTKYQFGSRYEDLFELRILPEARINPRLNSTKAWIAEFDTSCVERTYGREVPLLAPQVPNAFVFRYETKVNKKDPFNSYMAVKYRCYRGFFFANAKAQALYCKEAAWVGEIPRCINGRDVN